MAAKKKNAETLDAVAPSAIAVDAHKLSQGLKMTFEGMAMVFDSMGVDMGAPTVKADNAKIGSILKTYGVAKVGDLPASKYEAFLTDLSAI